MRSHSSLDSAATCVNADPSSVPVASVIVPSYNTAAYIAETLDSLLNQNIRDPFEVIVINDGSPDTDELEKVLEPYSHRIRYHRQENTGLAGARNTALRFARGEFVTLLDSDDTYEPQYLELMTNALKQHSHIDIVCCDAVFTGSGRPDLQGKRYSECYPWQPATFPAIALRRCAIFGSVAMRRSMLQSVGGFDARLRSCEDFDMWLRCVKAGHQVHFVNQVLVRYRQRGTNLSASQTNLATHTIAVLRRFVTEESLTPEERTAAEQAIAIAQRSIHLDDAKLALAAGDYDRAARALAEANQYGATFKTRMLESLLRTKVASPLVRALYKVNKAPQNP